MKILRLFMPLTVTLAVLCAGFAFMVGWTAAWSLLMMNYQLLLLIFALVLALAGVLVVLAEAIVSLYEDETWVHDREDRYPAGFTAGIK